MIWYTGEIPNFLPVLRKGRQAQYAQKYPLEMWGHQALLKDYGEGVREWVPKAVQDGRKLCQHFFVPGKKFDRIYEQQRDLWPKAFRELAPYVTFSTCVEFDVWYDAPLMVARRLQYRSLELSQDISDAGIPLVWLLLDTRAGGEQDLKYYAGRANDEHMRHVATNLQGARDKKTFKAMLQVLAAYHMRLNKDIEIIVNGPGSEARIRTILRLFNGRKVHISNAARVERERRAF